VQALVADGVGIALMPRLTVNFDDPRTRFIDVAERFPARLLGLVWHRDRELSAPVQALMEAARAICDRLSLEPPALIASDPLRQNRRRRHPQEGTPNPRDRRAT